MSESNIQASPGSIFICYRREDSADVTGRIYDRLVDHFGPERVFMDVEAIRLGYDFRSEIDQTIKVCSIVIVVIGDKWLAEADGKRRIDDENDRVRIEIESALRREIPIIPVLTRGTSHPTKAMLPASLEALAYRHGTSIRHEHFRGDVDSLISQMDKLLARQESTSSKPAEPKEPTTPVKSTETTQSQPASAFSRCARETLQSVPNPDPRDRPAEPDDIEGSPAQTAKIREILPYALIALASFLCGIGVLVLMLWKAETLTKLGLIGNLYYVVLLPLGLCAAVFLFGVVRSFARYKGEQYSGTLELGGPIVAFVLVVGGGFVLVPKPPSAFPLTVYVHGEADRNDLVLRNSGRVFVDLDGDRQSRSIGENGEAYFPAIPDRFRGQEVPIWVDAKGFESTVANQKARIDGASLYLPVRRKSGHVSGRVQDQDGNPIANADLTLAGLSRHSDASGHFEFVIPGDKLEQEMDLQAVAHGYKAQKYKVVPNANELSITLPTAP